MVLQHVLQCIDPDLSLHLRYVASQMRPRNALVRPERVEGLPEVNLANASAASSVLDLLMPGMSGLEVLAVPPASPRRPRDPHHREQE